MVSSFSIFRKPNTQLENNTFRPNKKIPVFKVTRLYLNLLVKIYDFFSSFLEKYIILCILKGEMTFKMHKIIYFFQVCLPYLNFSDPLSETYLFFYLA